MIFLVLERAPNIAETQHHLLEVLVCSGLLCEGSARARKRGAAEKLARPAAKGAGNVVEPAGQVARLHRVAEISTQIELHPKAVVGVGIAVVRHDSGR